MATIKTLIGNIKPKGGNDYSKDEQLIGKWVDGKPLYRRYFNFTTGSQSKTEVDIPNYSDIEIITNIYGTYSHTNSTGNLIYANINLTDQIITWVENGKINALTISNYYNSDVHIFIEYTKTT